MFVILYDGVTKIVFILSIVALITVIVAGSSKYTHIIMAISMIWAFVIFFLSDRVESLRDSCVNESGAGGDE